MPTSPDERTSAWLGLAALAIVVVGIVEWRALRVPAGPAAAAQQTALPAGSDVSDMLAYLAPDSSAALTSASSGAAAPVALVRDPFGASTPVSVLARRGASGAPSGRSSAWRVNAVLITPSYRAAIINDVLVHLGGTLSDGTRLTAVEHDHVVLTDARGASRKIDIKEGA